MSNNSTPIHIGRQAIYDAKQQIFGYELLYRANADNQASFIDADRASSDVLLNAFLEIGVERIVGPYKAFINLTRRFFTEIPPLPFDTNQVILELLEDIEVDQQLIDGVIELHKRGYKLAIDDFTFEEKWDPILKYVSIIKVECPSLNWDTIATDISRLKQYPVKLLAEKIETHEEFERLKQFGFDYYQGYFFARPNIIAARKLSENNIVVLQLLSSLNSPDVTIEELNTLIQQDPSLSYKILRYINSAAVGLNRKVDSIQQAVIYMGLSTIKAWATLLAISGLASKDAPNDLITNALTRGYMCKELVAETGENADIAFTVGTLSILDSLLGVPLNMILPELPLSQDVTDALIEHKGLLGEALVCALAFEQHEWDKAVFNDLPLDKLNELYLNSSHEAFRAIMGMGGEE